MMSKQDKQPISIIVVTYNSGLFLPKLLQTIRDVFSQILYEIVIVDNNSSDNTTTVIKHEKSDNIIFIKNKSNHGFAKAVNQGIRASANGNVLLVNPDIELNKSFRKAYKFFLKSSVDILGIRMINSEGHTHGSVVRYPNLMTGLFDMTNFKKIFPNNKWTKEFYYGDIIFSEPKMVDAVSGGLMLIKRRVLSTVGELDEGFFMYLEDIDFCLRAHNCGFNIWYYPNSDILHIGGASSHNKYKIHIRGWLGSRDYYFKKYYRSMWPFIHLIFLLDESLNTLWHRKFL